MKIKKLITLECIMESSKAMFTRDQNCADLVALPFCSALWISVHTGSDQFRASLGVCSHEDPDPFCSRIFHAKTTQRQFIAHVQYGGSFAKQNLNRSLKVFLLSPSTALSLPDSCEIIVLINFTFK